MDKASPFTSRDICRFQSIYEKTYGVKLDKKSAFIELALLVRFVELTCNTVINENEDENDLPRNSVSV